MSNEPDLQKDSRLTLVLSRELLSDESFTSLMTREGFTLCGVTEIRDLLDKCVSQLPHLVIIDGRDPGMDVVEYCHRVHSLPASAYIAVLAIIDHPTSRVADQLYGAGANSYEVMTGDISGLVRRARYVTRGMEEYRQKSRDRFVLDRTLDMAQLGNWEIDIESGTFSCSEQSSLLMGHKAHNPLMTLDEFLEPVMKEKRDQVREAILEALNGKKSLAISYPVAYPGSEAHFILNRADVFNDEVTGRIILLGVVQNITAQKKTEAKIRRLAFFDSLTGLSNRIYFMTRLEQEIILAKRAGTKFALMYLDLDQFKIVNDTFGHHVGDELLKKVAHSLRKCTRASDAASRIEEGTERMIARLGGDEFTLIVNNIREPDHAALIARRIIEEVPRPVHISGHEIQVTTSIGIAMYPQDGGDANSLLKHADTAMYKAKSSGRNNYQFFRQSLNDAVVERFALEREIAKAIERGEFSLVYQPLIDAKTEQIVGAEALIRWSHSERGNIPPGVFIPVAEESGLIVAINRWVVVAACRQWQKFYDAGLNPGKVSVNLSGYHFAQQKVLETVMTAVEISGLAPDKLDIEITENILMQDVEETAAVIDEIKAHGVSVSLDDFGTGYSSLGYLTSFHVDSIKVDKSFVINSLEHEKSRVIIRAIVAMGRTLGIRIIAEGVESREQFELVKGYQVDQAQGYYFSQPLVPEEFASLLTKGT